ncbi:MAG: TolB family protein [Candidatus Caldatribacteriaceae bacterium]
MHIFDPSFHPMGIAVSGHLLAVSGWNRGYPDIALIDLENQTFRFLFEDRFGDLSPTFSPAGDFLYFTSDRSGTYDLYAYSLGEGTLFRLTNAKSGIFEVTFSGEEAYCVFLGSGGYHVGLLDPGEFLWERVETESEVARDGQPAFEIPHTVGPYRALWRFRPFASFEGWGIYGEDALRRHALLWEEKGWGDWVLQYENRLLPPELILWTHLGEKEEGSVTLRFARSEGYTERAFILSWGILVREDEVFQGVEEGWWGNLIFRDRGGTARFLRSSETSLHLFFGRRGDEEGFRVIAGQKSTLSCRDTELAFDLFWGHSSFPLDFEVGEGLLAVRGYSDIGGKSSFWGSSPTPFPYESSMLSGGRCGSKTSRGSCTFRG